MIKSGLRYRFPTNRVLASWNFTNVVPTTEAAVKHYRVLKSLGFREGTLLREFSSGKIYLVSGNKLRHVTNPDVLERLYMSSDYAIDVSSDELALHQEGEKLN